MKEKGGIKYFQCPSSHEFPSVEGKEWKIEILITK